ncbi:hypothetical protein IWW50_000411 [Coemansia erecta]|nr:hypothetical protein GGF43_000206 [Coemansia sp. RSA 2618]KAJ2830210.1 hypothetical protein IWW50_000411 [Coemansia erecta]
MLLQFLWLPAILVSVLGQAAEPCNGHVELCGRAYNNVSFACTHNSYSYPPPHDILVLNQEKSIADQLADGIRAFMLDVVKPISAAAANADDSSNTGTSILDKISSWISGLSTAKSADPLDAVHLCHGSCLLIDKGTLADTLTVIKEFMDANPREIITLIIENVSGFTPQELSPSFDASGIAAYAFGPAFAPNTEQSGYPWPTLEQMIAKNQRLVTFIDDKADTAQVPYILPEWDYVVEIPYANIHPVDKFPCNQERPRDGVPRDLIVMNHFVYNRATIGKENIDTPITAQQVKDHAYNALSSLDTHWSVCKDVWGNRVLNFITLDYYDIGDGAIFELVDQINGFPIDATS